MTRIFQAVIFLLAGHSTMVAAETVTAAVAANFSAPMQEIAAKFEQETGHNVVLIFGASGKFFAQIKNGAPFDIFLSADQTKPEALEAAGLSISGSRFTYAIGALVLWSSNPELVDKKGEILKKGNLKKLAIANPKLAPYGAAAVETLEQLKLYAVLRPKLVQGENIAQTYQFVASGNAELGFVALSQIMQAGKIEKGSAWLVPQSMHSPIRQDVVLLPQGKDKSAAKELLKYLQKPSTREIIESYGYKTQRE